jgi:hypothetical protein
MAIRDPNFIRIGEDLVAGTLLIKDVETANLFVTTEANLGPVANITITGGSNGQALITNGNGTLSWGNVSAGNATNANYANFAGSVTTASQPNITSVGTLANLTSNGTINLTGASNVSLGAVGNVKITGGSNGQVLTTNGNGTLSWGNASSGSGNANNIVSGTSNVNIATANGNVTIGVAGNAAIATFTGTGANIGGTLQVGGVSNLGPVGNVIVTGGANGQILTTNGSGALSWSDASGLGVGLTGYAHLTTSSSISLSTNTVVPFTVAQGTLTGASNGVTLKAGKTYRLTASIGTTGGWFNQFMWSTASGTFGVSSFQSPKSSAESTNYTVQSVVSAVYTPTVDTAVFVKCIATGGGNASLNPGVTWAYAEEIGSSTLTGNISVGAGATATSSSTGALIVNGGLGVSGNAYVGTNLNVTGTTNVGAVGNLVITGGSNGQVLTTNGNGTLSWANGGGSGNANNIVSGTSNVNIASANGNVTIGVAGNAAVATFTGTGANISGNLTVTGKTNVGAVGNLVITGGSNGQALITNGNGTLSWGNVSSGNANYANFSGSVTTAAQGNITSVGTLTGLTVSGTTNLGAVGNVKVSGGSNGQVLLTDGNGNLTWSSLPSVSVTGVVQGSGVNATGNSSSNATDWVSINLPSAGTYRISAVVRASGVANLGGLGYALYTNANALIANTETLAVYSASSSDQNTGTSEWIYTATGAETMKVRFWNIGNATGAGIISSADGRSYVTYELLGYNTLSGNVTLGGGGTSSINGSLGISSNLNVTGTTNVGAVGNLVITGGSNGQALITNGNGVLTWGNVAAGDAANAANANYANFAGTAYSVSAANVSGTVANATFATSSESANTANLATFATTANAVAGANVSGTVANATFATTAGSANTANLATYATTANAVDGSNVSGTVANATFATSAESANTANTANLATYATTANAVAGANVSGWVANANIANIAYSVSAANISGTVANATFATSADSANTANLATYATTANAVAGANVSGTVANANVANTAYSVDVANVTGIVSYAQEFHVDLNGNDTTGTGSVLRPYRTIQKAIDTSSQATKIVVHPGGYYEDVTMADKPLVSLISSATAGISTPSTPTLYGNLTVSGNSSSIAVSGISVMQTITHSSSGSLYLVGLQLGSTSNVGALTKTGSGYLALRDINAETGVGANLTSVTVTGNGPVVMANVAIRNLTVNNASTSVTVTNGSTLLNTTHVAGTLNIFDSFMVANSNTTAAITSTSTGGVLQIRNSAALTPTNTLARINIGATTVLAYGDLAFDRANSNVGFSANITVDFQSLRAANTVTATLFSGSGASLTSLPGANVSGTVANAAFATSAGSATSATTAGTVTTAAQGNITSVGTLTGLTMGGNIVPSVGNTYNLGSPTAKWANIYVGPNSLFIQDSANSAVNAELQVTNGVLYINGAQGVSANIVNGTSNVLVASSGNISFSSAGTSNVVTISNVAATVNGNLTVTGRVSANSAYGMFWNSANIANPGANTAAAITWNAQDGINGMSYSGANITIARAGKYNVQFNAQVTHAGGGHASNVYFWMNVDGTDVPGSGGVSSIQARVGVIQSWNALVTANANSVAQMRWASAATDITLTAYASAAWHPAIPSALITITPVGA